MVTLSWKGYEQIRRGPSLSYYVILGTNKLGVMKFLLVIIYLLCNPVAPLYSCLLHSLVALIIVSNATTSSSSSNSSRLLFQTNRTSALLTKTRKAKISSATSLATALNYLQRKMARSFYPFSLYLQLTAFHSLTDAPQQRQRQQQRRPVEPDAFGSSGESSDAYVQERNVKSKRRVKRREDDEPRRVQKKRKRKQPLTEEDLNELPPEKGSS